MSGLFGGGPKLPPPQIIAPPPQVDDAQQRINESDRMNRRQGRASTLLTGDAGLPNLGATTKTGR